MKRTIHNRFDSKKLPSDVTVHAGGTSFSLHKVPLVSKCGYIRKVLVSECGDAEIEIPDIPGGAEAFELAAKFCYGINFEIGTENIVMLRCVAEYLEMTEDYAVGNLVEGCEAYLNEMVLNSLSGSVLLLQTMSLDLLPMAEKVNMVNRCIDAIACMACKESQSRFCLFESGTEEGVAQWWAEDLTALRIDHFQRVVIAMKARGFEEHALAPVLMLYAQKSLRGLMFGKGMRKRIEATQEHEHGHEVEKRVVETITSLLPREKDAIPVSFISMLLRSATYLETTVACRLDLENRMALHLGQAELDDLLLPSYGHTLFDVDTVHRIMANYLTHFTYDDDDDVTERVGKLMQSYLAEVATDLNLSVSKFTTLAHLIPQQSTITHDAMYRAIHIYLKAHPDLNDVERKKVCSLMDCQKLSREALDHAARNDSLPVRTVVQVLYYELQRLRHHVNESRLPRTTQLMNMYSDDVHSAPDREVSVLQREREKLKMELVNVNIKLKEIQRMNSGGSSPQRSSMIASAEKPSFRRKTFINLVSKKLAKLSPFARSGANAMAPTKPPKHRRHSIS